MSDILLEIRNLSTYFETRSGVVKAVDGLDLTLRRNHTMCVVGESGSGKSMTASSILQILKRPGRIVSGEMIYHFRDGRTVDIARLDPNSKQMRAIRGKYISMIFQEPMTSMSPVHTIGSQISEMMLVHEDVSKAEAKARTIELLTRVRIPDAAARFSSYPFQLSGGMRQRAMIAMALACRPDLVIADEPTTALDVTTQANVLNLMREIQRESGISIMLITHDLGVVAEVADDVTVMYLGRTMEQANVFDLFNAPKHPYTRALLGSVPRLDLQRGERLTQIRGMVPNPFARPTGCPFVTRCPERRFGLCDRQEPDLYRLDGSTSRCFQHDPVHAAAWAQNDEVLA
ncbi:ABC transporter ATP-binding protein [Devosia nitrariae]|uniref:Dipeptide/oligopeptide/nickel ABC transporter ATP-binding protein n=1 Tax=Devosia nitrariae TaxID=2071872 RepID=A0ABQ5W7T3_9HYPH|nr:ABC transporter ATP-binding protein [Devosia nitrariae]GLQ56150.1 dipeptide/oligopeptide/nickel ABC transporter ATP-binding protein [Devosia nitrariae]